LLRNPADELEAALRGHLGPPDGDAQTTRKVLMPTSEQLAAEHARAEEPLFQAERQFIPVTFNANAATAHAALALDYRCLHYRDLTPTPASA
jgi:hypothetical protein